MRKGKKVYSLIITYDDATEEMVSIHETVSRDDDPVDDFMTIDESFEDVICLEDYYDEKWFELIADCVTIGYA
tara:strand:+ start:31841 stop:32059 length:219 start_codon:yes stop_codon:yes gene_type:complete